MRGLMEYYGANRTGRWAGRLIQPQNLPRNYLAPLDFAREFVKSGDMELLKLWFSSVPDTLSQLIRTAFTAYPGKTLCVADYSAIEARVIAWLAGEEWVLEVFRTTGKIYEATASQMFKVPMERIVKGNEEYALRQRGKVATLALGYGGGEGALVRMGALEMGLKEDELPDIKARWRETNPNIVRLWGETERAALAAVNAGRGETHGLAQIKIHTLISYQICCAFAWLLHYFTSVQGSRNMAYLLCFYVLCYNRSCQPRGGCALERAASRLRAGEQEAFIKQLSGPVQQLFNRCACDPDGFLMRFFCAALVRRFGPPRPPRRLSGGKNKLYVYKTALCERRFIYVCRWEKHHA